MNLGGRPSDYTDELGEEICLQIATNSKSLADLCEAHSHWPAPQTIRRWLLQDRGTFRAKYEQAKEWQSEISADECLKIADNEASDLIENEKGVLVSNSTKVSRDRLRIDTRKWFAEKLKPKKYGANALQMEQEDRLKNLEEQLKTKE